MTDYSILTELLNLSNVKVTHYQLIGADRINLFVEPTLEMALCPDCHQPSSTIHEITESPMLRDLSIWEHQCWLRLTLRRFKCANCHSTFVERLAWREPNRDDTMRYEQYVYQRTRKDTILQVSQDEQLSEEIVQGIFERWAKKRSRRGVGQS